MKVHKDSTFEFRCWVKDTPCYGSDCMAWKWYYDVDPAYKHPTDAPAAFAPIPRTIKTEFGYCGKI